PLALHIPPESELLAAYRTLAFYPSQPGAASKPRYPALEARTAPRHLIVIGLETAPRAFYPLTSSPDLPTFARMTQHAIVSDHHYTTSSYTRIANFSMLSGLYAPSSGLAVRFGPIATDSFASVLRTRGYETSYVDSWVLDWLPGTGERMQAQMLGFDTIIDSAVHRDDGVYEVLLAAEEVAFDTAFRRVTHAQDNGHKAAVFVGTMLGHGPWPAPQGSEALSGAERLHQIALVFDRLLARMLERLAERGLAQDVIIVVAGDHGLRYAEEFESLGRHYSHSDLSFNVPFLLYAPGLIEETIHLPYNTSHIDISPTLLHLVGVPTHRLLYDGSYMLDERLADRILYLSNSRLGPLDGLRYRDLHFTYHALSGVAELGDGGDPPHMSRLTDEVASTLPPPLRDPSSLLAAFDQHANLVAGRLLQRGAGN
ncbi:MAG TPA: sulfatase-like hydrolase/transferase, partial [Polyangiales bacterium]|nr:sulfatase-like hydrolase/transferase [Polyangiales bacterium]